MNTPVDVEKEPLHRFIASFPFSFNWYGDYPPFEDISESLCADRYIIPYVVIYGDHVAGIGITGEYIPMAIEEFTSLKFLEISLSLPLMEESGGFSIPFDFSRLTKLNILLLRGIKEVPESLGKLTQLSELRIDRNQLTELPDSLANLTSLTYLHIHDWYKIRPTPVLDRWYRGVKRMGYKWSQAYAEANSYMLKHDYTRAYKPVKEFLVEYPFHIGAVKIIRSILSMINKLDKHPDYTKTLQRYLEL